MLFRHWPLTVTLVLYIMVGVLYSINTPLFEGSDEPAHFDYIRALLVDHALPMLDSRSDGPDNYEQSQPPLYYAAAALATFWIGTQDFSALAHENPHRTFDPLALTNRNLYLHTNDEDWPYHDSALAVHAARWISLLFGAGVVIATYGLAHTLFPARPELWAGATAFVAFVPQFDFSTSIVSNDSTVICIVTVALWLLARIAVRIEARQPVSRRDVAWLGLLVGLGPLAKESGLALLPFALLLLVPLVWMRVGRRAAFGHAFLILGVFVLVAGWWYLLRHEALGFWLGNEASARRAVPLAAAGLWAQSQEVELSFWGLFGWNIVPLPQIVYDGLHRVTLLALLGLAVFGWRNRANSRQRMTVVALLVWSLLVLGAFLRWVTATDQPHGRLLFPALPAFALLVCLGLTQFSPARWRVALVAVLASALCLISVWAAASLLPSAYPSPTVLAAGAPVPNLVNANLGGQIELVGYEWRLLPHGERNLLEVDVYWKATVPIENDYSVSVQAFVPDGRRVGQLDTYPFSGMYPTSDWQPGEVVRDVYPLMIEPGAAPLLKVMIGMYDLETGKALQVIRPDGTRVGRVTIEEVHWFDMGN